MYRTKRKQKRKRKITCQRIRKQTGGFLNHYNFAYTERDVVNEIAKVTPGIIKGATNEINNIAQQRINQVISQGSKEIGRVLPKILRGAFEDVYQTPFRLLRNFGKKRRTRY